MAWARRHASRWLSAVEPWLHAHRDRRSVRIVVAILAQLTPSRRMATRRAAAQVRLASVLRSSSFEHAEVFGALRAVTRTSSFDHAVRSARNVLVRSATIGWARAASGVACELTVDVDVRYAELAHELALRVGDVDDAARIASLADDEPWMTPSTRTFLEVERRLAANDAATAATVLGPADALDERRHSEQFVRAMHGTGRYADLVAALDADHLTLAPATTAVHHAEAAWWLGDGPRARRDIEGLASDRLLEPRIFHLVRELDQSDGRPDHTFERIRRFETTMTRDPSSLGRLIAIYWDSGSFDDVDRLAAELVERHGQQSLSPAVQLNLVRADYARRRLDDALARIDHLRATAGQAEAEKLRSRIMLERGQFTAAIAHREANPDPVEWLDEVHYHALLRGRRYTEAFGIYLPRSDRDRLAAVFGPRAEFGPELDDVTSRLQITQSGPGDEVSLSCTYPVLAAHSGGLVSTCDPRLEPLLRRSFPSVDFLPVDRVLRRRLGALGPDRPARSGDSLFAVLTASARDRGLGCDRVVLGRSLQGISHVAGGQPYPPSLVADPSRRDEALRRWSFPGRTIGVVWRSEFRSPMRAVHYLDVADLRDVTAPDDVVVCLQYDVDPAERHSARVLWGDRLVFADDVDIRNDFESAAVLVASLDVVVGVGTTIVELSAAVGTPTVLLTPNHHGSWRATDAAGHDYWHRSMRVAAVDEPWDRAALAARGRELVDEVARTHVKMHAQRSPHE